jgi:hypothetical protein
VCQWVRAPWCMLLLVALSLAHSCYAAPDQKRPLCHERIKFSCRSTSCSIARSQTPSTAPSSSLHSSGQTEQCSSELAGNPTYFCITCLSCMPLCRVLVEFKRMSGPHRMHCHVHHSLSDRVHGLATCIFQHSCWLQQHNVFHVLCCV